MPRNAQRRPNGIGDTSGADRLAGLGAAELEDVPSWRVPAEIMVERNHPVHVRSTDIQARRNQRLRLQRNTAEPSLNGMQDREQQALSRKASSARTAGTHRLIDNNRRAFGVPWLIYRHLFP